MTEASVASEKRPVSFRHDVMAVLSKAGCNQGTCHGNATGKGGLKLSLRGDDPESDFQKLTRALEGRRINLGEPAASLILRKATMNVAHEGGRRFTVDDPEYRILHEWIAQGARDDGDDAPRVTRLVVTPRDAIVTAPVDSVSLRVEAQYADGSTHDVTRLAVFEPSQPIVRILVDGIVSRERLGEVTIAVRFLDHHAPVRLAFVPERPEFTWKAPSGGHPIDQFIYAKLESLRVEPSEVCDDTTFLRRASLDLLGLPPTAAEVRAFLDDESPTKREAAIDRLLTRPEFAEYWALKWSDLLRNEEKTLDRKGVENFHAWIRHQFAINTPLDLFARELISARGSTYASPAANFYRAMRDPITRAESTAQLLLGVRLQCAKCHNHPFDRWTQDDYYSWANLFARVDYKILENRRRDRNDKHEFIGEQIVFVKEEGDVRDPRTGQPRAPRVLAASEANEISADRLHDLAEWVTHPANPFFAKAQVNRIWFHLFGRGIVDPIDDFRITNPPSHPALLDWLAEDFVAHGYDLRHTIRTIMTSQAYQLSSQTNETNIDDEMNFSHAYVRRLSAEQLLDAISQVVGVSVPFNGYPVGTRATQIPGVRAIRPRDRAPTSGDAFLTLFGKPPRLQPCEYERATEATLAQTFELISGPLTARLLTEQENRIGRGLEAGRSFAELLEELYWEAVNRPPTSDEREFLLEQSRETSNQRQLLEDVAWSLLNSNEFLLRR